MHGSHTSVAAQGDWLDSTVVLPAIRLRSGGIAELLRRIRDVARRHELSAPGASGTTLILPVKAEPGVNLW